MSFIDATSKGIEEIPRDIEKLTELTALYFGYNKISELPDSLFKLKQLELLCLHANKLTTISDNIGNLSKLKSLKLSNNNITRLPDSIFKLKNLEILEIENTYIQEMPMDLLKHKKINKLSVNDSLLPFIIKNREYLDVDSINLTASRFTESSNIIKSLNFNIITEEWLEEVDKKENACIVLSKFNEEI